MKKMTLKAISILSIIHGLLLFWIGFPFIRNVFVMFPRYFSYDPGFRFIALPITIASIFAIIGGIFFLRGKHWSWLVGGLVSILAYWIYVFWYSGYIFR